MRNILFGLTALFFPGLVSAQMESQITRVTDHKLSDKYDVVVESPYCDLGKAIYCIRAAKLIILPKGATTPIQTITADVRVATELDHMIRFADLNFDGEDDLILTDIFLERTIDLFDPAQKKFIESDVFTSMVVGTAGFFPTSEKLIEVRHDPQYYQQHTEFFRIAGGKPVLVKEVIETFPLNPLQDKTFMVISRKLEGDQWITESRKIPVPGEREWQLPGGKAVEVPERINVIGASDKFDVSIELPTTRAKGKKSEITEGWYSYREGKPAVFVIREKTTGMVQKINARGTGLRVSDGDRSADRTFNWQYGDQHWVKFSDINFDGFEDLLLLKKEFENNRRYECYLYSPADKMFMYNPELSGLYDKWWEIDAMGTPFHFTTDAAAKTITIDFGDDTEKYIFTYALHNNIPELVRMKKLAGGRWLTAEVQGGVWRKSIRR